ncbi:hypothetical protein ABZX51_005324 [Aspergillus tubingensis]
MKMATEGEVENRKEERRRRDGRTGKAKAERERQRDHRWPCQAVSSSRLFGPPPFCLSLTPSLPPSLSSSLLLGFTKKRDLLQVLLSPGNYIYQLGPSRN